MDGGDAQEPSVRSKRSPKASGQGWRIWSSDPLSCSRAVLHSSRRGRPWSAPSAPSQTHERRRLHAWRLPADLRRLCAVLFATDHLTDSTRSPPRSTASSSTARVGDMVEARGEVMRAGGSLVFVRGISPPPDGHCSISRPSSRRCGAGCRHLTCQQRGAASFRLPPLPVRHMLACQRPSRTPDAGPRPNRPSPLAPSSDASSTPTASWCARACSTPPNAPPSPAIAKT